MTYVKTIADLFLAQVVHATCHVSGEVQQLLGRERGGRAVSNGKGWVCFQDATFPEEIQQVAVRSILDSQIQIT